MQPELTESEVEFLIDLAREQAQLVDQLQEALERNDTLRALELAREICGMPKETAQ